MIQRLTRYGNFLKVLVFPALLAWFVVSIIFRLPEWHMTASAGLMVALLILLIATRMKQERESDVTKS